MALSQSLLTGANSEWSLVRRHPSEKTFGAQVSHPSGLTTSNNPPKTHLQIAGAKIPQLVRAAEVLKTEFGPNSGRERAQLDFVDVNCGCPIDMVFRTGAGSARKSKVGRSGVRARHMLMYYLPIYTFPVLESHNKLGRILIGMSRALGEVPLTIKVRTGIKDGRNTTHKLMPRLARWGVNGFSVSRVIFIGEAFHS